MFGLQYIRIFSYKVSMIENWVINNILHYVFKRFMALEFGYA